MYALASKADVATLNLGGLANNPKRPQCRSDLAAKYTCQVMTHVEGSHSEVEFAWMCSPAVPFRVLKTMPAVVVGILDHAQLPESPVGTVARQVRGLAVFDAPAASWHQSLHVACVMRCTICMCDTISGQYTSCLINSRALDSKHWPVALLAAVGVMTCANEG